ncbi:MAG: MmcQ/YjbR family DNA-binding protein [Clostridia bacterium]|nr:MmcQ/YjbR family DNA-binding protein [Clostridia bacterium]NCC42038.1 MmcQ/YjbR family DNA-binding protein [Clostridia bacterium]
MDKKQLETYINGKYNIKPDYMWADAPNHQVYRNKTNRKWFALVMDIPRCKLGLEGDENIDVLDIKCEKDMVFSLLDTEGYFPAYHMNKANWITVILGGSLSDDIIKSLLDMSYGLVENKKK